MNLLTSEEVAARLRIRVDTLRAWRVDGRGPEYKRLGTGPRARVRYLESDVDAFVSGEIPEKRRSR